MGTGPEGKVRGHEPSERLIRLTSSHLDDIRAIASHSFSHVWGEQDFLYFLENDSGFCFGWLREGKLAAYFLGLLVQGDLDIISIATRSDLRRRGIAGHLLTLVLAEPGVKRAFLEVDSENTAAIALYEKMGFTATGRRKGYYGGTKDAVLMARGAGSKTK